MSGDRIKDLELALRYAANKLHMYGQTEVAKNALQMGGLSDNGEDITIVAYAVDNDGVCLTCAGSGQHPCAGRFPCPDCQGTSPTL